jgi:phage/conjugal plasmid C-4 type zinc finger TraR family protein
MSDIIDRANKTNSETLARQINKQREQNTTLCHVVNGIHYCIDCDNPIRPERVAVAPNAPRCIFCQTDFEKERSHFA